MKSLLTLLVLGLSPVYGLTFAPLSPGCASWQLGAEWIYFSPNSESVYYAVESLGFPPNTTTQIENNAFNKYYSGFRVFGQLGLCNRYGLYGSYGRLEATKQSSISAAFPATITNLIAASPTSIFLGSFSSAQANTHVRYQEADGLFLASACLRSCFELSAGLGAHYGEIRTHSQFIFAGDFGGLIQSLSSNFWGVGPEVSLEGCLGFWQCLSVFGRFAGAFVIGEPKESLLSIVTTTTTTAFTLQPRSRAWRSSPFADVRLGLSVTFALPFRCLSDVCFRLEAGYEALAYWNALRELSASNAANEFATGELYLVLRNFTLHGPFISGEFRF